jgi:alkaline phosphatase D
MSNNISNVVVLTGDIHSSWANDLPLSGYNGATGANSAGVEFVAPSVTSPGISIPAGAAAIQLSNSHIKYADLSLHGFVLLTVTSTKAQADWYYANTIDIPSAVATTTKSYYVNNNERFLRNSTTAMLGKPAVINQIQSPPCPRPAVVTSIQNVSNNVIINLYPNPAVEEITFQYSVIESGKTIFNIYDINGKKVMPSVLEEMSNGVLIGRINVSSLTSGIYFLEIKNGNQSTQQKFIKQ